MRQKLTEGDVFEFFDGGMAMNIEEFGAETRRLLFPVRPAREKSCGHVIGSAERASAIKVIGADAKSGAFRCPSCFHFNRERRLRENDTEKRHGERPD